MGGKHHDTQRNSSAGRKPATRDDSHSPKQGATTTDGGYAEQHGPRVDGDGWGEANTGQTGSDGASESDGHKAGERSFDDGGADTPADKAAPESKPREPGKQESTKPVR